MSDLAPGSKAPDFTLARDGGGQVSLSDYRGRNLVLYFYPRDDTPGCTKEAIGFTDMKSAFEASDTDILGVSADTVDKHDKFIAKHDLGIALASDPEAEMISAYGVWVEKNMYGKKYMGIERATYLIDGDGIIREVWRKVKVPGHVEKVLDAAKAL